MSRDEAARDLDWQPSRASSPPAPPSVPAFGSIVPQPVSHPQENKSPQISSGEAQIHPSRRALLEPTNDRASTSPTLLNVPTAPKAQHRHVNEVSPRPTSLTLSTNQRTREPPREPAASQSKRFPQQGPPTAPRASTLEQPSVRKALDEQGRNGNIPSIPPLRPPVNEPIAQVSPVKIPTGPRAGRGGPPSIRQSMRPSITAPINMRPPPSIMGMGRGRGQPSNLSWRNPDRYQGRGAPSIMNKVPTKREREVEDDEEGEEESRDREEQHKTISPEAERAQKLQEWKDKTFGPQAEDQQPADIKADAAANSGIRPPVDEKAKEEVNMEVSDDEATSDNDNAMDLDDADFQKAQRNHERELRRLEGRRPPPLASDVKILQKLEELDALANAMKDKAEGVAVVDISNTFKPPLADRPPLKQEDRDDTDLRNDTMDFDTENLSLPPTPPLESLPFLKEGSPTPFSDFEELQTPRDGSEGLEQRIFNALQNELEDKLSVEEEAKRTFAKAFKPWRKGVDAIEASIREEHARENSTPPETAIEASSAPQTVRSRRIVSDYGLDAIMKESMETAAREEQARREREEREAQVYIPADTFNPDREAVIPAMLSATEARDTRFLDYNEHIPQEHVLEALRYSPPADTFSKEESREFLYHYLAQPKKFGDIAEKLKNRSYKECVRHYYASKKTTNYPMQLNKFSKTGRGKKVERDRAAAGVRSRGGLLATFDGPIVPETGTAPTTESGRPRRAAAPTFGDAVAEAENITPAVVTPVRRPTAGKDGMLASQSSEKTEKAPGRRPKGTTGQKPGRKPKGQQLLAAAPPVLQSSSPQKEPPQVAPSFTSEPALHQEPPRVADEREAAQLLASLPNTVQQYPVPSYTEHWVTGHPPFSSNSAPPMEPSVPRKPEQVPQVQQVQQVQQPSQAKSSSAPEATSYWSVPEKQDFVNYVGYFGTNWQKIAQTMKTKTTQMIKNHYQRELDPKKGEKGRELERKAHLANERIKRGEDMGPLPAPTPVQPKRRYDPNTTKESQRPLAPSIDLTGVGDDSPSLRPVKTQMSPPSMNPVAARFSASSQAEQKAAASSAQVLAQGPQSPANRAVLHMQNPQRLPNAPGQQASGLADVRSAPHNRPILEATRRDEPDQVSLRAQRDNRDRPDLMSQHRPQHSLPANPTLLEYQNALMNNEPLELQQREQEANHMQQINRKGRGDLPIGAEVYPSIEGNRQPRIEIDERSRRIYESRQDEMQRQAPGGKQPSVHGGMANTVASHRKNLAAPTSTSSSVRAPPSSLTEPPRPSSVPVNSSTALAQPPQPRKTSNIMFMLNTESEEPKVSRKPPTPDPWEDERYKAQSYSSTLKRTEPQSQYVPQHAQALGQQHRQDAGPISSREAAQGMQRASMDERSLHPVQASIPSQQLDTIYTRQNSRPGSISLQARERSGISPMVPHSRSSSYSKLVPQTQQTAQHAQIHPQAHTQESQQRPILAQTASDSRLRANPWTNITPPQSQQSSAQASQYGSSSSHRHHVLEQQQQNLQPTPHHHQQRSQLSREQLQPQAQQQLYDNMGREIYRIDQQRHHHEQPGRPVSFGAPPPSHDAVPIDDHDRQRMAQQLAHEQHAALRLQQREREKAEQARRQSASRGPLPPNGWDGFGMRR